MKEDSHDSERTAQAIPKSHHVPFSVNNSSNFTLFLRLLFYIIKICDKQVFVVYVPIGADANSHAMDIGDLKCLVSP